MKPITIDAYTKICGKCRSKVSYAKGIGEVLHGTSESYDEWDIIKHDFCPQCGEKVEYDDEESDETPRGNLIYQMIQTKQR